MLFTLKYQDQNGFCYAVKKTDQENCFKIVCVDADGIIVENATLDQCARDYADPITAAKELIGLGYTLVSTDEEIKLACRLLETSLVSMHDTWKSNIISKTKERIYLDAYAINVVEECYSYLVDNTGLDPEYSTDLYILCAIFEIMKLGNFFTSIVKYALSLDSADVSNFDATFRFLSDFVSSAKLSPSHKNGQCITTKNERNHKITNDFKLCRNLK